jgi:hypothetical protein
MSVKKKEGGPAKAPLAEGWRGSASPEILEEALREAHAALVSIRDRLSPYSVTFTPRDRLRLRGVGIKRQGFVSDAFASAAENDRFLPKTLPIGKFRQDLGLAGLARDFLDITKQLHDYAADFSMLASDIEYNDAVHYYKSVIDAFERRIDGAESVFRVLSPFFKNMGAGEKGLTEKKLMADAKAALHGKKDAKIVIENASPKAEGGRREVIDAQYDKDARQKGAGNGEFNE